MSSIAVTDRCYITLSLGTSAVFEEIHIRRVLNGPVPGKSCSERDRESLANLTCFGEFSSNPFFSNSKKKALFV